MASAASSSEMQSSSTAPQASAVRRLIATTVPACMRALPTRSGDEAQTRLSRVGVRPPDVAARLLAFMAVIVSQGRQRCVARAVRLSLLWPASLRSGPDLAHRARGPPIAVYASGNSLARNSLAVMLRCHTLAQVVGVNVSTNALAPPALQQGSTARWRLASRRAELRRVSGRRILRRAVTAGRCGTLALLNARRASPRVLAHQQRATEERQQQKGHGDRLDMIKHRGRISSYAQTI